MKFGEVRRYSVKQLLENKPDKLEGFKADHIEGNKYSFDVNRVTLFANSYELLYGEQYVIIAFYNQGKRVASLSAFCGEDFDEGFIVEHGSHIVSETSLRVMNSK
ncbi:MAG: hypothetical protein ACRDD7_09425 [Peptostreptococcaceae bacterium]